MGTVDADVARLYQLPLEEFTRARNELAKRAGGQGGIIRTLRKPPAAAWAINQLYWKRRKTYDRLIAAAERLRAAHAQMLAGKRPDLAAVESAHRQALKAAADEVREILRASGEEPSPATLTAVNETLQALPGPDPPGQLARPLKPLGFEALAGLAQKGVRGRLAEVVPIDRGRPRAEPPKTDARAAKREAAAAKREAEARKREATEVAEQLRDARAAERQAKAAFERAQAATARAESERRKLTERLEALETETQQLKQQSRMREKELAAATAEQSRLAELLETLRSPH